MPDTALDDPVRIFAREFFAYELGSECGAPLALFGSNLMLPHDPEDLAHFVHASRKDYRSDLKLARSSSEKACGCSHAAKCVPFGRRL